MRAAACRHRARRGQAPREDAPGLHRRGAGCSPEAGLVMPDHDPEAVLEPRGSGRASRGVGADLRAGEGRDISGALRVL